MTPESGKEQQFLKEYAQGFIERPMPESEMAKLEVPRCPTCGSDDPRQFNDGPGLPLGGCFAPNDHWAGSYNRTFHQSDTESEEGT